MIIERTPIPITDRLVLPNNNDIYNRWMDAIERIKQLEDENRHLNAALQSYTRTVVENNILKEKLKELEDELKWQQK